MGLLPVLLIACSKQEEQQSTTTSSDGAPKTKAVYVSPLRKSGDPAVMKAQQNEMVDRMIHDPHVDLATIEGEAYRRGVTLTPEQIAFKKANPVDIGAPPGPAAPPPAVSAPQAGPTGTTLPVASALPARPAS